LEHLVQSLKNPDWIAAIAQLPLVRESRSLPAGAAARITFQLMALAEAMSQRSDQLA
jgi:hypothetical protein